MADTLKMTKLAAVREAAPTGTPAPCFFHCPCGGKVPAFEDEQTCPCGAVYDGRGWLVVR